MSKTPQEARELISTMVTNSQHFGYGHDSHPRRVNEVSNSDVNAQIASLTSIVRQLVHTQMPQAKACGICTKLDHTTDMCPSLQEKNVNAVGGYNVPQ